MPESMRRNDEQFLGTVVRRTRRGVGEGSGQDPDRVVAISRDGCGTRVYRTGRRFEVLGLRRLPVSRCRSRSAVAELAMPAAELAANGSKPLTANAAIRLARDERSQLCWT
jgi:hypothetical protein